MRISKFYQGFCNKSEKINALVKEDVRPLFLHQLMMQVCRMLGNGCSHEQILEASKEALLKQPATSEFDWQAELQIKDDLYCIRRFLDWLGECEIVESCKNIQLSIDTALPDGSDTLEDTVGLIVCFPNGVYGAILPFFKKADKSLYGKSVHTAIGTDLHALTAKAVLEKEYPGIVISSVYLRSESDQPGNPIAKLSCGNTMKSNVFSQDFSGYITDGVFDMDFFMETIKNVARQPVLRRCDDCKEKELCHSCDEHMVIRAKTAAEQSSYVLPQFTNRQKTVIEHDKGPMLVCAGPGSGKTATLVGRVKHLMDNGVPPEVILVITFTNEAADELRNRCQTFCAKDCIPKISTINALGFEILRENSECLERGVNLMRQTEQMQLIKALLSVAPPLSGFKYGQTGGKYGLYKTVLGKIDKYLSCSSKEEFFLKEPSLDTEFVALAEQYKEIVRERGYITFDEQVTLCNELFERNPAILGIYQHLYQYVMVDEYQDINADQSRFINAIAAHGNIVAVGDDDQSVYGFRGASNKFMLHFNEPFPDAVTVVLNENFRSVQSLVTASQRLIQNNTDRIPKDILSKREGTSCPVLIKDCSAGSFDRIVEECQNSGFHLEDIAILSTRNAPLEQLHKDMHVNTVLAKSFLRDDPLFLIVHSILLLYADIMNESALFRFLSLMGVNMESINRQGNQPLYEAVLQGVYPDVRNYDAYEIDHSTDSTYSALRVLSSMFYLIDTKPDASFLLSNIAYYLGWEDAISFSVLQEMIEKERINTADALKEKMCYMVEFEDDTRIDVAHDDAVLLITSHESKGKEFPVVLMLDNYSENTEESRRLFYVAMTRAKDRLYIFKDNGSKDNFLSELPNLERREIIC